MSAIDIKKRDIVHAMMTCYETDLKIKTVGTTMNDYTSDPVNHVLERLLSERKRVARIFIDKEYNYEEAEALIEMFSKYNENIIQTIGLYTL